MADEPKVHLPKEKTTEYQIKERQREALLEMDSCGKNYTPEKIQAWKELGLTQPEWISDRDWATGADLNPRQLMICKAASLLMNHEEIAQMTGMSASYVSSIVNSAAGKAEIDKIQDKFLSNTRVMLEDIIPLAIKTAFQVMMDPKTKAQTRADAAFRFMDRVMGRPVQKVEVEDNLIRKVYERLEQSNNVIDISNKRPDTSNSVQIEAQLIEEHPEETSQDPVDAWLKENL